MVPLRAAAFFIPLYNLEKMNFLLRYQMRHHFLNKEQLICFTLILKLSSQNTVLPDDISVSGIGKLR